MGEGVTVMEVGMVWISVLVAMEVVDVGWTSVLVVMMEVGMVWTSMLVAAKMNNIHSSDTVTMAKDWVG